MHHKPGKLFIFSAPSGAGKTTIVQYLLSGNLDLEFSISATSRKKRPNEVDGRDYYFLNIDDFRKKIENNEFLEWEEVYKDQYYGTLKSEVERITNAGRHVVFDVDVKGGLNIKNFYKENALAIFVMPPSPKHLEERLRLRSTESEDQLKKRVEKANMELLYAEMFDRILINDDLDLAKNQARQMVLEFIQSN